MARKTLIWEMESRATDQYFQHLRETRGEDGSADDFHLRILRELKRIHSLIAALAYPILDRAGYLQSRIVQMPEERDPNRKTQHRRRRDRASLAQRYRSAGGEQR